MCELFVTSAQVKDEGPGIVFLQRERDEIHGEGFSAPRASGKERMAYIVAGIAGAILDALMKIQIERRSIDGFHDGQGLPVEKRIPAVAFMKGEQERPIGIVVVRDVELAEIEMAVAGACGEKCR